jgi:DnaJ-class molecular chaperone
MGGGGGAGGFTPRSAEDIFREFFGMGSGGSPFSGAGGGGGGGGFEDLFGGAGGMGGGGGGRMARERKGATASHQLGCTLEELYKVKRRESDGAGRGKSRGGFWFSHLPHILTPFPPLFHHRARPSVSS